tara:strand:- start:5922 stop:6368 length:447 start_codon:yes stop_codon:yes gene_type:complete
MEDLIDKEKEDLDLICNTVCDFFKLSGEQLFKKSRNRAILVPRQYFHYLAKIITDLELRKIAIYSLKYDNGYDHATVLHSKKTVLKNISIYRKEKEVVEFLERRIKYLLDKNEIKTFKADVIRSIESCETFEDLLFNFKRNVVQLNNI